MAFDVARLGLSDTPIRNPDCCLSLSWNLFTTLTSIFKAKQTNGAACVLSVGSGSGLLEAAFMAHASSEAPDIGLTIQGIEVQQPESQPTVNKYLPEQYYHTVRGTWDISPRLKDSDISAVMFVYPRQPALVSRYVDAIRQHSSIKTIVWLGPVADWEEYSIFFQAKAQEEENHPLKSEIRNGKDAGLDEYEMMAIISK